MEVSEGKVFARKYRIERVPGRRRDGLGHRGDPLAAGRAGGPEIFTTRGGTTLEIAGGGVLEIPVALKPAAVNSVAPALLSLVTSGARDIIAIDGKVLGSQRWALGSAR
jgi:hypothetical protein